MRWLSWLILLGVLCGAGCRRPTADEVVQEALRLAKAGDSRSMVAAAKHLAPLAQSKDTNAGITALYLVCLWQGGNVNQAETLAADAAKRFPDSYLCSYLAGKLAVQTNHTGAALPLLRNAYKLNPKDLNTLTLLAYCAGRENDPQAQMYFAWLEHNDPTLTNKAQMYNEWALWQVTRGRYVAALDLLTNKAMGTSSPSPSLALNTAVIFERQHLPRVARKWYEKYLADAKDKYPEVARQVRARLAQLPQDPTPGTGATPAPGRATGG